jgi:hypothetical protein
MPSNNNDRKITNEDAIHIGLATKDPGAYLFATIVIELIKLPFTLTGGMLRSLREAKAEQKAAATAAAAKAAHEQRLKEEAAQRMEERKKAYLARVEKEKRQAIVASMMPKPAVPEVDSRIGDQVRQIWREEVAPGLIFDTYLYALELFKTAEGRAFVTERGLSPERLIQKLEELHNQNKQLQGTDKMRLTPLVRAALYSAGKAARERFKSEHPGQSGVVEVTTQDLLEGVIRTKDFVPELDPIWEHLRQGNQNF